MLNFKEVSLRRGGRLLFQDVSFTIHQGQKVGVTGVNGCGKSSLFTLIQGHLQPDAGEVTLSSGTVIAHVAQETPALDQSAVDFVVDGDEELRSIQDLLAEAEQTGDGNRLGRLHGRIEAIDGYTARSRALRLLHGLGFTPGQEEKTVASFSGGWRVRLNLARALMCRSELLLLDEPSNHLDLDAVIWLQEWLRGYPGTLLLISHDRDFLDEAADHIAHVDQSAIDLYPGNYSAFEKLRAEKLSQQQAAHLKQQREVERIRHYVDRFRAKATKARQAQSRLKTLARMEKIAPAHVDSPFHFVFGPPRKLPYPLLQLRDVAVGYGRQSILSRIRLDLSSGDRIGLLGINGAGKSTLIKLLAGELAPLTGEYAPSPDLRIGYFAQHQLEQLRTDESPLQHLLRLDPAARDQELRNFLGGFAFRGDMATSPVAPFSGGEKARLALALLVYQRPNLVLLDEPTNHLDLEMRHAIGLALQTYQGALIVISHDRHLLRSVTDTLLLVKNGAVQPFTGDLDDYRRMLATLSDDGSESAVNETSSQSTNSNAARKERRRLEAEQREQLRPLREKLRQLDQTMDRLHAEKYILEERLADISLYEDAGKEQLKELLREQGRLSLDLERAEEAWMEVSEELESIQS